MRKYQSRSFQFASRNFYTAFLAALEIDSNPERYFPGIKINPPSDTGVVVVPDFVAADTLADALNLREPKQIYRARRDGEVVAVIIPAVAPDGYTGDIELIVGVNRDGSIAGVRALSHKETPGLGDKVDTRKSDWVRDFEGRSLANPGLDGWAVKKDKGVFDQFTGATITPRAVVAATLRALQFAEANRKMLFADQTPVPAGGDS